MKQEINESVHRTFWDLDGLTVLEAVEHFLAVAEELSPDATLDIDPQSNDYQIRYTRLETDEEYQARIAQVRESDEEHQAEIGKQLHRIQERLGRLRR